MLEVNWTQIKEFTQSRVVSIQWVLIGENYHLRAFDGGFTLACAIPANRALSNDTIDFEDNFKINGNVKLDTVSTDLTNIKANTRLTGSSASASFTAVDQQISMLTLGVGTFFVRITGTFSGLVAFEGEVTAGVWVPIRGAFLADTGITLDYPGLIAQIGTGFVNPTGYLQFRVRCHTYISGTMGIVLTSSVKPTVSLVQPIGQWAVALREGLQPTYSASITNLVAANTPTDIFTLSRSGTKGVRITRIRISATQTTGTIRNVSIIKRSTANAGGTSTTLPAVPHSSFDAAAQSTVRAYTANPTALGTTVGTILSDKVLFGTTAVMINSVLYEFGNGPYKAISLGSTEMLCVNLNGVTSAGNLINVSIEWIEQE